MVVTVPVSLVVPVLNEEESISELLDALALQTAKPAEIIFCDAGSSDRTVDIIQRWWKGSGWESGSLNVLIRPNAFPGAGRNFGVKAAHQSWVAFIDAGIVPDRLWLEKLYDSATSHDFPALFGVCRFIASGAIPRAVCALSYGYGATHPVVPASLFHKSIFDRVGFFEEDLRAAEDMVWVKKIEQVLGKQEICKEALVTYSHFPKDFSSVAKKWYLIQKCSLFSGVRVMQLIAYTLISLGMIVCSVYSPFLFLDLMVLYFLARGVVDPWRRSKWRNWAQGEWKAFFWAIPLALVIDVAKISGIFAGIFAKPRKNHNERMSGS